MNTPALVMLNLFQHPGPRELRLPPQWEITACAVMTGKGFGATAAVFKKQHLNITIIKYHNNEHTNKK